MANPQARAVPASVVQTATKATQQTLPDYLVYHHFLAWAAATDRQEKKNGATDANAFAKHLVGKPAFTDDQLSLIRKHAYDLENDLGVIDLERQQIVHQYRVKASAELSKGHPLPPEPPELRLLEQKRTSVMIQHYVVSRSGLGSSGARMLDGYLHNQFYRHLNLQQLSTPQGSPGTQSAAPMIGTQSAFQK